MYRSYKILKLMHFLAQSVDLLHLKKYATFVFTIALTFAGILMPPVPTVGSKTRYVLRSYVWLAFVIGPITLILIFCMIHYFRTKYLMDGFQWNLA